MAQWEQAVPGWAACTADPALPTPPDVDVGQSSQPELPCAPSFQETLNATSPGEQGQF